MPQPSALFRIIENKPDLFTDVTITRKHDYFIIQNLDSTSFQSLYSTAIFMERHLRIDRIYNDKNPYCSAAHYTEVYVFDDHKIIIHVYFNRFGDMLHLYSAKEIASNRERDIIGIDSKKKVLANLKPAETILKSIIAVIDKEIDSYKKQLIDADVQSTSHSEKIFNLILQKSQDPSRVEVLKQLHQQYVGYCKSYIECTKVLNLLCGFDSLIESKSVILVERIMAALSRKVDFYIRQAEEREKKLVSVDENALNITSKFEPLLTVDSVDGLLIGLIHGIDDCESQGEIRSEDRVIEEIQSLTKKIDRLLMSDKEKVFTEEEFVWLVKCREILAIELRVIFIVRVPDPRDASIKRIVASALSLEEEFAKACFSANIIAVKNLFPYVMYKVSCELIFYILGSFNRLINSLLEQEGLMIEQDTKKIYDGLSPKKKPTKEQFIVLCDFFAENSIKYHEALRKLSSLVVCFDADGLEYNLLSMLAVENGGDFDLFSMLLRHRFPIDMFGSKIGNTFYSIILTLQRLQANVKYIVELMKYDSELLAFTMIDVVSSATHSNSCRLLPGIQQKKKVDPYRRELVLQSFNKLLITPLDMSIAIINLCKQKEQATIDNQYEILKALLPYCSLEIIFISLAELVYGSTKRQSYKCIMPAKQKGILVCNTEIEYKQYTIDNLLPSSVNCEKTSIEKRLIVILCYDDSLIKKSLNLLVDEIDVRLSQIKNVDDVMLKTIFDIQNIEQTYSNNLYAKYKLCRAVKLLWFYMEELEGQKIDVFLDAECKMCVIAKEMLMTPTIELPRVPDFCFDHMASMYAVVSMHLPWREYNKALEKFNKELESIQAMVSGNMVVNGESATKSVVCKEKDCSGKKAKSTVLKEYGAKLRAAIEKAIVTMREKITDKKQLDAAVKKGVFKIPDERFTFFDFLKHTMPASMMAPILCSTTPSLSSSSSMSLSTLSEKGAISTSRGDDSFLNDISPKARANLATMFVTPQAHSKTSSGLSTTSTLATVLPSLSPVTSTLSVSCSSSAIVSISTTLSVASSSSPTILSSTVLSSSPAMVLTSSSPSSAAVASSVLSMSPKSKVVEEGFLSNPDPKFAQGLKDMFKSSSLPATVTSSSSSPTILCSSMVSLSPAMVLTSSSPSSAVVASSVLSTPPKSKLPVSCSSSAIVSTSTTSSVTSSTLTSLSTLSQKCAQSTSRGDDDFLNDISHKARANLATMFVTQQHSKTSSGLSTISTLATVLPSSPPVTSTLPVSRSSSAIVSTSTALSVASSSSVTILCSSMASSSPAATSSSAVVSSVPSTTPPKSKVVEDGFLSHPDPKFAKGLQGMFKSSLPATVTSSSSSVTILCSSMASSSPAATSSSAVASSVPSTTPPKSKLVEDGFLSHPDPKLVAALRNMFS